MLIGLLIIFGKYYRPLDHFIKGQGAVSVLKSSIDSNKVLGMWTLSVQIENGISYTCFACPEVNFNSDNSANVSSYKEVFKWKIKDDTMYIYHDSVMKHKVFKDNKYLMSFEIKKNYEELVLSNTAKSYSYILRRECR